MYIQQNVASASNVAFVFFFTFLKFKLLQVTQTVGVVVSITQKMSLIFQQWYYYVYFY